MDFLPAVYLTAIGPLAQPCSKLCFLNAYYSHGRISVKSLLNVRFNSPTGVGSLLFLIRDGGGHLSFLPSTSYFSSAPSSI